MSAKRIATVANETQKNENPLISNRLLRQIYTKLVEIRAFDEYFAKTSGRIKSALRQPSIHGQEAARVSTLIELKSGDLISDASVHPTTELILAPQSSRSHSSAKTDKTAKHLPPTTGVQERLQLAMGAALALKTTGEGNIVIAFASPRELSSNSWRKILTLASQLELPIIFVVIPTASKKNASITTVADKARLAHVPGIPVDSSDAIALFRVMQESLGRTRGGDGPVVIECLKYASPGQPLTENDAILQMGRFLLERKVCSQAELDAIHKTAQRKLRSSRH